MLRGGGDEGKEINLEVTGDQWAGIEIDHGLHVWHRYLESKLLT